MRKNYRAGQMVKVRSGSFAGLQCFFANEEALVDCIVVCATPTGAYYVAVKGSGLVTVVDADDITSAPEVFKPHNPSGLRVVFFGNGDFALPVLERLVEDGYDIRAVVTNPDSKQGRGRHSKPTLVAQYARGRGLNILTPLSAADPGFVSEISRLRPSVGVIVEYGILPKAVYRMPEYGTINLHSSLLPEYRGASTVSSAIRDGKSYTGLTTFTLSDRIDGGDIINNMFIPIEDDDNSEDVLAKMRVYGPGMIAEAIQLVAQGCKLTPQDLIAPYLSQTSYAAKVFHRDLEIDWHCPAKRVCDFIRAYTPKPSAWTDIVFDDGKVMQGVKIGGATATNQSADCAPGTWRVRRGCLQVATSDYIISINRLQVPGRRWMDAEDFCNGFCGTLGRTSSYPGRANDSAEDLKTI